MARYKIPYPGLNESLKHLKKQVVHSLPYTVKNLPRFTTPEEVFNFCKSKYTFRNDPPGTELFQTVPTLLEHNDIGTPGAGDCDDATIFCLAELLNSGFTDIGIVLTGRNKLNASHIYCYCDFNGKREILDLTNKKFNQERPYPFKQYIPFKISKTQLDMFLQLADGMPFKRRKKRVNVLTPKQKENAIFLPSKNVFLPIHKFDSQPIPKVKQTLLSEGYDLEQLSEYLSGRAERKARKKEKQEYKKEKRQAKLEKQRAKTEIKKAKAEKKRASGEAKKMRAEAKIIKSERQDPDRFSKIFKGGADIAKSFFNKDEEPEEVEAEEVTETEYQEAEVIPYQEETEQTDETELQEGIFDLDKKDLLNAGLFALGFYLEKTKKVA